MTRVDQTRTARSQDSNYATINTDACGSLRRCAARRGAALRGGGGSGRHLYERSMQIYGRRRSLVSSTPDVTKHLNDNDQCPPTGVASFRTHDRTTARPRRIDHNHH